jgi:hypothetical protein
MEYNCGGDDYGNAGAEQEKQFGGTGFVIGVTLSECGLDTDGTEMKCCDVFQHIQDTLDIFAAITSSA